MEQLTLAELQQGLKDKRFSSLELTQSYLARIKDFDATINSFITVTDELALTAAKLADEQLAKGNTSPLTGIPLAHKDIFCTDGVKTSCASKMLDNFIAPYNATVIEKLNQQHSVMLGKTNMDEFAMGSSNENSFYGACKNPWEVSCVPGGSSGGSAAAVAAGFAPAATGTDTGGSIRQPAAFCGLTGLKPTYGVVSRYGMVAYASSLDQGGVITKNAEDAAIFLNAIAGFDAKDSTSVEKANEDYTRLLSASLQGKVIGLPEEYFSDQVDSAISQSIEAAKKVLEQQGVTFKSVNLKTTEQAISAYYIIAPSEASANLQRYDGVRYGYRCDNPKDLEDMFVRSRTEAFGEEVQRRILIGTYALSAGFYDAYYRKAQKIRRLIKEDFENAFAVCDFILAPTTPTPAFKIGANTKDPVAMYLEDIFTISVNLAGLPALSLPCGFKGNLPIGMQLIGKPFSEAELLQAAHQFQQATDWHTKTPVLTKA
ncbi:MAG: Asp-tRNA(Asn)/Glu-tRNA(Gln) amidotransferase subunit GatA [Cellvibrionales bacterium]|nr:Asp-tRNA(Asn)/Glu-tRNA(Gln) amidotransferase subunit GatA [Cellvibrionales bacterium]